jgi:membrane fusion protein (multidrug efflux system)
MRKSAKKAFLSSSLTAIALGIALSACSDKPTPKAPPPAPVSVLEIKPESAPMSMEIVGETAGYRDVDVRSRVNGILLRRTYTEGQNVNAGQVLFEIDPEPYKAALDRAKGVLAQQAAQLEKAKADRDRIIPLYKENAVSRKDYDDAMANYNNAIASSQSAQASVTEAELNLGYTKVTAPISGLTSKLSQSEGSLISVAGSSGLLTTISQIDPLYVNFSYSELDKQQLEAKAKAGKLNINDLNNIRARIKLADGSIYEQSGKINFSDNRVDPKTGTIQARAIFSNPKGQLLPGQFARVLLDFGQHTNVIMVPEQAILQQQADKLVLTIDAQNKVVPRPVKVGDVINGKVLIESGLSAGDKVIVEGLMKAAPGAVVNPSPYKASAPAAKPSNPAK